MSPAQSSARPEDVRQQILDAARERFEHFGFRKTTMTEIADDVSMSPANLYRYFASKHEICAACATECMAERIAVLRAAAHRGDLSAADRLRLFFRENLRVTQEFAGGNPRIGELVETISTERPDLVRETLEVIVGLLAEVLAHGNETGEFEVDDVVATARSVHATMVLYEVPMFTHLFPREVLERGAGDVAELVLAGLNRR